MNGTPLVRPFAGLRYTQVDLSGVLAPPYDIITPAMQQHLEQRDPHNVVRLELAFAGLAPGDNTHRYHQAADTLRAWREQRLLAYDRRPCLYPAAHQFTLRGKPLTRWGVLCVVRLTPFQDKRVLAHEGTLPAAREDRRRLMLACQAQTSPVLALHDDPRGEAMACIEEMTAAEPLARAEIEDQRHQLWRRSDELVERYCRLIGQGPLFIADGHHRYETALEVAREMRQAYPEAPADAAFEFGLMLLCPAPQPGIVILPTHRLLRLESPAERDHLAALVERNFVRQMLPCDAGDAVAAAQALVHRLDQADGVRFGIYTRAEGCALLAAQDHALPNDPGPGGYDELATVLAHRLLIDPVVGAERVEYVTDEEQAVRRVTAGDFDCALFLRPTTVTQMQRVAQAGLRMPGKSTYFYPKAPAGLVIHDLSPERSD